MAEKKRRISKKREKPSVKVSQERKKEEMERGQVWSVDVLLAVVIFISVILIFYVTMTPKEKPRLKDLESEAKDLKIELEQNHELGFINADEIDEEKLNAFIENATPANYQALKQKLGIKGDFCIFYEDAEGHIILIRTGDNTGVGSVGSPDVLINNVRCGENITWS